MAMGPAARAVVAGLGVEVKIVAGFLGELVLAAQGLQRRALSPGESAPAFAPLSERGDGRSHAEGPRAGPHPDSGRGGGRRAVGGGRWMAGWSGRRDPRAANSGSEVGESVGPGRTPPYRSEFGGGWRCAGDASLRAGVRRKVAGRYARRESRAQGWWGRTGSGLRAGRDAALFSRSSGAGPQRLPGRGPDTAGGGTRPPADGQGFRGSAQ
jgi:hypothetical protein